jgi:hypothetical protein
VGDEEVVAEGDAPVDEAGFSFVLLRDPTTPPTTAPATTTTTSSASAQSTFGLRRSGLFSSGDDGISGGP